MDQTPEQNEEGAAAATLEDRLTAVELLLQHLVTVMDAEPTFTAGALDRWLLVVLARMRECGAATPAQLAALGRLRAGVSA